MLRPNKKAHPAGQEDLFNTKPVSFLLKDLVGTQFPRADVAVLEKSGFASCSFLSSKIDSV